MCKQRCLFICIYIHIYIHSILSTLCNRFNNLLFVCRPILVLGLIWQIIKIQLLSSISLKNYPELVLLLQDGESMGTLLKLSTEDILIRWVNYHMARARSPRRITNFGKDIQVCCHVMSCHDMSCKAMIFSLLLLVVVVAFYELVVRFPSYCTFLANTGSLEY